MAGNSQFFFAWVGSDETDFNESHLREDELIFGFELNHDEGQFAELTLEIANPYVGLLAPGRPLWAWFSWSDGEEVYPLFFGRLVGIPDDLFGAAIKIKLVAKPQDYEDQRIAVANGLRVLPYFDPVFIDEKKLDDPDTALEGYSALWHVDRITHEVTISDIIAGEDGTAEFTQNDVFYDKVAMRLAGAPLLLCEIEAEVEWTQCDHTGKFELKTLPNLPNTMGFGPGLGFASGGTSFPDVKQDEPTQTTYSWDYKNITPGPHKDGDLMEESGSMTAPFYGGEMTSQAISKTKADPETGTGEEYSIKESYVDTETQPPDASKNNQPPPPATNPNTQKRTIAVELQQDRKEAVYVAVRADVQPVLAQMTVDEKSLSQSLTMNGRDVVAAGAATAHDGVYFPTSRGQQSVEYLLMVARAHLLAGARVVEISWECMFSSVVGLSCRMNATIEDPRLPGDFVLGKIVHYQMTGSGDDGQFVGAVTIHCAVGNADPIALMTKTQEARATPDMRAVTQPGTPVYVEEGYVNPGYQHYDGRQVTAITSDMSFGDLPFNANGLQLPITQDQILVRHEYHDAGAGQGGYDLRSAFASGAAGLRGIEVAPSGEDLTSPPAGAMAFSDSFESFNDSMRQQAQNNPSWVEMEFKPVQNIATSASFQTTVTALEVPKQIDLSAA